MFIQEIEDGSMGNVERLAQHVFREEVLREDEVERIAQDCEVPVRVLEAGVYAVVEVPIDEIVLLKRARRQGAQLGRRKVAVRVVNLEHLQVRRRAAKSRQDCRASGLGHVHEVEDGLGPVVVVAQHPEVSGADRGAVDGDGEGQRLGRWPGMFICVDLEGET